MENSTISMAMFNSKLLVSHYQRVIIPLNPIENHHFPMVFPWCSHGFPIIYRQSPAIQGVLRDRFQVRQLTFHVVPGGRRGSEKMVPSGYDQPSRLENPL